MRRFYGPAVRVACIFLLVATNTANAEYLVTGSTSAEVCHAFGTVCKIVRVDAVSDPKGNLFELPRSYPRVDSYSGKTCSRHAKPTTPGILGMAIQAFNGPTYMQNVNGEYRKVDAERIIFPCRER